MNVWPSKVKVVNFLNAKNVFMIMEESSMAPAPIPAAESAFLSFSSVEFEICSLLFL